MSAPDTNLETQEKRHYGPLGGMPLAIILASVVFLAVMAWMAVSGDEPREEIAPAVTVGGTE